MAKKIYDVLTIMILLNDGIRFDEDALFCCFRLNEEDSECSLIFDKLCVCSTIRIMTIYISLCQ